MTLKLIIIKDTPYEPVTSIYWIKILYFDWERARLAHGKPKGPKLLNHSIVTIRNGKKMLPLSFLLSAGNKENKKPPIDQKIAK